MMETELLERTELLEARLELLTDEADVPLLLLTSGQLETCTPKIWQSSAASGEQLSLNKHKTVLAPEDDERLDEELLLDCELLPGIGQLET